MKAQILSLIIALCAEDKECLSQAILLDPKTERQAVLDVRAVKARDGRLHLGYNECGPNPSCFRSYEREDEAQFLFRCERKGKSKDCGQDWFKSPKRKKIIAEWDALLKKENEAKK